MTNNQKKKYLEKFHDAYYRYIQLDEDLKGLKAVDISEEASHSSQHITLTERIYKRDKALADVFNAQKEIETLCNGNPYIMARYACFNFMTNKEIASMFNISETTLRRRLNEGLSKMEI